MEKTVFKNLGLPLALSVSMFAQIQADALQIVYPKSTTPKINASSTFFVGNTTPGATLKINNKEVKVYDNGAFVEVVPLVEGENKIVIESVYVQSVDDESKSEEDSATEQKNVKECATYIIQRPSKAVTSAPVKKVELVEFPENEYIYAAAVKNNVPLRQQPNSNARRVTHISKDTVLMLNGKKGDYYRVSVTPEKTLWVHVQDVVNYSTINTKMLANITNLTVTDDKLYTYIKTDLSFPIPFIISETDKGLNIDLHNINEHPSDTKIFKPSDNIQSFVINNVTSDNQSTYFVELTDNLWGYDAYYEGNTLVLKIRKNPQIDEQNPLKNITIALDAGHGGKEAGAIGPTCVKEKDINLEIAQRLKRILEKAGANVFMTRNGDFEVGLYERVDMAKKSDALILLSIHANALPDGLNPYEKHGTSVFYYNNESKKLADTVKKSMLKELALKDDGTRFGNFVLTRTGMPLAILIETAYMINPEEYNLLLDDDFKQKAAESIKSGLEDYLLNSINNNK